MLIPPSLLMIVYAVLAEESVGRIFLAGVGPGLLLALIFSVTIILLARSGKSFVAGAAGAFGALVVALARRSLDPKSFWRLLVETGQITVSVLFLILAATFFSRMLALSGVPRSLAELLLTGPIGSYGFLILYLLLIVALGCLIDSISIMLILLPIALPVAEAAGFDLIWFGVLTVVSVEIGLLTPPFGISVYIIKSAIDDPDLQVGEVFRGAFPFVLAMLVSVDILIAFPSIATWLARL